MAGRGHKHPKIRGYEKQERKDARRGIYLDIGGLLLLCDATHKYLRTDTVYQVMYDIYDRSPQTFEEEARGVLIGHTVLTR